MSQEPVQQSLFDEESNIEQVERDKRMHKAAFRAAFNFLAAHYPANPTEEYWTKMCDDIRVVSYENVNNELCQELLAAVILYLSKK